MNIFEVISEQRIKEAINKGLFQGLSGEGKPLQIKENPFLPEDQRLVFDLLNSNGFSLPWIERAKEIQVEIVSFRQSLKTWYETSAVSNRKVPTLNELTKRCEHLNKKIMDYNMSVSLEIVQMNLLIIEEELTKIREASD